MNTISSTSSTDYLYELEKIQQAKALERTQAEKKQEQQSKDTINISQQAIQALGTNTQITSSSSPLDSLVSAGTITQDQANAVISAFQSVGNAVQTSGTYSNNIKKNPLDSLVSAGTITQDQEKSIQSAFQSAMKSAQTQTDTSSKDPGTTILDSLVSAGTITQAQETSIQSAFKSALESAQSQTSTLSNPFANALDSLVSAGTITQDQENSIESAFKSAKPPAPPEEQSDTQTDTTSTTSNPFTDALDSLASAGTITQDQETSIESAFDSVLKEL